MTVIGNKLRISRYGKVRAYGGVPHGMPSWVKPRPFKSCWSQLFHTLTVWDSDRIARASASALQSIRYWTGSHRVDMKPGEWLVVLIGVFTGVVILYLAPAAGPMSTVLGPPPASTPSNNVQTDLTGREWDCTIVEDNAQQVKLVCEKKAGDSLKLIEIEPQADPP